MVLAYFLINLIVEETPFIQKTHPHPERLEFEEVLNTSSLLLDEPLD
jgi:hypothetical protein